MQFGPAAPGLSFLPSRCAWRSCPFQVCHPVGLPIPPYAILDAGVHCFQLSELAGGGVAGDGTGEAVPLVD